MISLLPPRNFSTNLPKLLKILITSGPTIEPIDPVRYLTNRSSGKMGYALARAAAEQGHQVLLISGPTRLEIPEGVDFLPIETAQEMYEAVQAHLPGKDIGIYAAAVADYTPAQPEDQKIKKNASTLSLELIKTKDVLGSAREPFGFQGTLIGFAAETQNLEENARDKLTRKGCDLVIANDVSRSDIGFDSSENEVLLVSPDRAEPLPKMSKDHLAKHLIEIITELHS